MESHCGRLTDRIGRILDKTHQHPHNEQQSGGLGRSQQTRSMDRSWQIRLGLGLFLHHYIGRDGVDSLLQLVDGQDKAGNVQRGGHEVIHNIFAGHGL